MHWNRKGQMLIHEESGLEGLCRSFATLATHHHPDNKEITDRNILAGIHGVRKVLSEGSNSSNARTYYTQTPVKRIKYFENEWTKATDRETTKPNDYVERCVTQLIGSRTDQDFIHYERLMEEEKYGIYADIGKAIAVMEAPDGDHNADFAAGILNDVVPAMVDGLKAERYKNWQIDAFAADVQELVAREPFDVEKILTRLIAAAIYGPEFACAYGTIAETFASQEPKGNEQGSSYIVEPDLLSDEEHIAVLPVYDHHATAIGKPLCIGQKDVLFIGRDNDAEKYIACIEAHRDAIQAELHNVVMESTAESANTETMNRELSYWTEILNRTQSHKMVMRLPGRCAKASGHHGFVAWHEGRWQFAELEARNGSMVIDAESSSQETSSGFPGINLKAGDTLHLGTRNTQNLYGAVAAILVARVEGASWSTQDD